MVKYSTGLTKLSDQRKRERKSSKSQSYSDFRPNKFSKYNVNRKIQTGSDEIAKSVNKATKRLSLIVSVLKVQKSYQNRGPLSLYIEH